MKHFGEWLAQQRSKVLVGVQRASPDDGASGGNETGGGDPAGDTPPAGEVPPPAAPPKGPRNPWLPSGDNPSPPRRSASIDDIFRPKKDGSGGGGSSGGGGKRGLARLGVTAALFFSTGIHSTGGHFLAPEGCSAGKLGGLAAI